ncbi:MAG: glycoside hydrolase family 127 protein [Bacteroidota bacterium]|nr:glycoside hydrolase family 127 protein [Bacteroidota bacterium]
MTQRTKMLSFKLLDKAVVRLHCQQWTLTVLLFFAGSVLSFSFAQSTKKNGKQVAAVSPGSFKPFQYVELPLGATKPNGWLLHQLQIMRAGTTGHLDEVHGKIMRDNGWLGGKGDGWEETPYWLDGATPLAYLLDDKELQAKVLRYINWTLDNQRPSGYFGPITKWERETGNRITTADCDKGEDWWPKMIMLKVLQQYYTATNDKRVIPFMTKFFDYQRKTLQSCPVGKWTEWSQSRGTENMLVAQWLYSITGDKSLLQLCNQVQAQSFTWSKWLKDRDWVINAAAYQNEKAWMSRHGVNVAMGIKDPVVQYQRTGDKTYLQALHTGFNDLMTLHGLPFGVFSADEDLHGNDPVQGTELCAVVEAMFSLEQIVGITGEPRYMDALERMTFNALPAQTTDDYNNKQYFQIANQVHIKRGVFQFSLPFEREMNNVLGMRSGYTCCLANMHQGWTKFASHLWYATPDKGLAALHFSPSKTTARVGASNTEVTIHEKTDYPFSDRINFELSTQKSVAFPLHIRIPVWCKEATLTLNNQPLRVEKGGQVVVINRTWKNGDHLTVQLPMEVTTSNWGGNSRAVERGPLVYALKLEERWEKGTDEKEGDYFSVFPKGEWNYGLVRTVVNEPAKAVQVSIVKPVGENFIWNTTHAPIELKVAAKKIPDWKIVNDVAPQPVTARDGLYMGNVDNKPEEVTLIPFGCTKVRIVAFPVVK